MESSNIFPLHFLFYIIPLIIWEGIWKGIALWKSARGKQLPWFIALLIINSAGILPIIYIVFFQSKTQKNITE